ncbi:hypothetical protein Ddye_016491 [Dipteronia dyeriana]|uniref:Transposase MuDR plant domain-containing protein n=1 Tax=Dipteronia dyeriana TaxID=168575 RepID=A0AAD9U7R3_9ROSI|nr:hypothetical protein Ddye_016491 [Dipteronia dyeriana]
MSDGPAKGIGDGHVKGASDVLHKGCDETLNEQSYERNAKRRKKKDKQIAEEDIATDDEKNYELVESDYEQEEEDMVAETCVYPTSDWDWDSLRIPDITGGEYGSSYEINCGSDDLRSLDEFDCKTGKEDELRKLRKFIKTIYHEFDPGCDIENLIFKFGIEFATGDVFRKAIRAHAVKHMQSVKFKKRDKNRIRAVCSYQGCKWFVFGSWLADHKTFKIKSLLDEHTFAMCF